MIPWLLAMALAVEGEPHWEIPPALRHDVAPPMPTGAPRFHGVVDLGDLVVVRPQGTELQNGFTYGAFTRAVEAALADRPPVDFACVLHSDQLPTQFSGAAAFHLTYNNLDLTGTGKFHTLSPDTPVRAALWMSTPDYWDSWAPGDDLWVFGQELGHYWLAFTRYDDGAGLSDAMLGRGEAHWSWFLDTPNSPMQGNPWVDNGDGSFTVDPEVPFRFSDLDLYLMGLLPPDQVGPSLLVLPDPGTTDRTADSPPEFLRDEGPLTITGSAELVTVDQVIAAEGPRTPESADAPRDFTLLPILVLGPEELLTEELLTRTRARFAGWESGWTELTVGLSTVDFTVPEPRALPEASEALLVPRSAW